MKIYIFDAYGLRFSPKYLAEMRLAIIQLPLEEQSEFVDMVTYESCKRAIPLINTEQVNADNHVINTTAIGNLAFIALNHPIHEQQVYAKALLSKIKKAR